MRMNMLVLGISLATVDASVAFAKMGVMFAMVSRWLHSEGLQVVLLVSHERECTSRFLLSSRCAPAFKQALIRRFLPRTSAFSQLTSTVLSCLLRLESGKSIG